MVAIFCGCGVTDAPTKGPTGGAILGADAVAVKAPAATPLATKTPVPAPVLPTGEGLVTAQFQVHANGLGTELCNGKVTLKVNIALGKVSSAQLFAIPAGLLQCSALGSIDLHTLLSGVATKPGQGTQTLVEGSVVSITSNNGAVFNPPRPMLPSFVSSTAANLRALNVSRQVGITSAKGSDTGVVALQTLAFNQPFTAPQMGVTFPKVIDFVTTVTGFASTDKIKNSLFDSLELHLSMEPIAVVALRMSVKVSDLSQGIVANQGSASGLINAVSPLAASDAPIFGFIPNFIRPLVKDMKIDLTMDLVAQEGLTAAQLNPVSSGEKLGGVATGR